MTEREPAVRVTLSQVYTLLLETSDAVKEVKQDMNVGDFHHRITKLEEAKWKLTGAAGVFGGVVYYFLKK
jgi:hypothetical protein